MKILVIKIWIKKKKITEGIKIKLKTKKRKIYLIKIDKSSPMIRKYNYTLKKKEKIKV